MIGAADLVGCRDATWTRHSPRTSCASWRLHLVPLAGPTAYDPASRRRGGAAWRRSGSQHGGRHGRGLRAARRLRSRSWRRCPTGCSRRSTASRRRSPATRCRATSTRSSRPARAHRDGRSEEYVVAALLHDIGDELAPYTHGEMVAAVLRPYIAPEICWIVKHHGLFQMYYYAHHSRRRPQRARPLPRPPLVRRLRRVLRALRPELLRPRLRLAAGGDVRADGAAGVRRAALPGRLVPAVTAARPC